MDTVWEWVSDLQNVLSLYPPESHHGEFLFATDGSAADPADPDCRQAACAIAWISGSAVRTWHRTLGAIESSVNAAELVAGVVVGHAAVDFKPCRFLTDHRELVRRASSLSAFPVSQGKKALWDEWINITADEQVRVSWVPSHGKYLHLNIPLLWRELSHHADLAAGRSAATFSSERSQWCHGLRSRRRLALRILSFKRAAFKDFHDLLLQSDRA